MYGKVLLASANMSCSKEAMQACEKEATCCGGLFNGSCQAGPMNGAHHEASAKLMAMQVVAMISTDGVFVTPFAKREAANAARLKFTAREGDHATLLAVARAFAEVPRKQQAAWCHDNFLNLRCVKWKMNALL